MSRVRCVAERYDASGREAYDDVDDFLEMCAYCHGERPLLEEIEGGWYDEDGLVLVPA